MPKVDKSMLIVEDDEVLLRALYLCFIRANLLSPATDGDSLKDDSTPDVFCWIYFTQDERF